MTNLSMQMYSLRNEETFNEVVKKLSEIGYNGVEICGINNLRAIDIKNILDDHGIRCVANHIGLETLKNNLDEEFESNSIINNYNLVCPMCFYNTLDDVKRVSDELNAIAEKCYRNGFNLLLHNHDQEFKKMNDKYIIEYFLESIPETSFNLELDVFWMKYANVEPSEFIRVYKNRCKAIHLKDLKSMNDKSNISLGKGIIDFNNILKSITDVEFIYEREDDGLWPWTNIVESFQYYNKLIHTNKEEF